jgi:hypothetical protein
MKQLYPPTFSQVSLPAYTLFTSIFVLLSGLFAQAQTTPVNGTTTFNTIGNGAYIEYAQTSNGIAGFGANNVQSSGWDIRAYTSGPNEYVIAGENWGASSDGGFVYVALNSGSTSITSMRFKANDGKLFDLNSLDLGYDVITSNTSFTITGFRNGAVVYGANYSVPLFASFGNGGDWSRGINIASGNNNFKGLDEFRITPNTPGQLTVLDIDNINATNFRAVSSYAQIIPADIPLDNEGAFTKLIAGHTFTFNPADDDYVSYLDGIGTEGYGGLYAYDYSTNDGTEVTISAPAGYTFDLSSFQYISDRGPVSLAVTLTFSNNSTDTKMYALNGNENVQTFSGFTTAANDVKSIRLVSDGLIYSNNFEVTDIKALTTLPLNWLQFSAAAEGKAVVLNWRTAAERGTKDFLVQHSTDGRRWQNTGTVLANGTSNAEQSYSFTHSTPGNGVNAYRLIQRDVDGHSSYSPVVTINVTDLHEKFSVYPNPVVNGKVQVKLQESAVISIYNSTGALVGQKQLPVGVSSLNLNGFAKGFYTIKVKDNSVLLRVP